MDSIEDVVGKYYRTPLFIVKAVREDDNLHGYVRCRVVSYSGRVAKTHWSRLYIPNFLQGREVTKEEEPIIEEFEKHMKSIKEEEANNGTV